MSNEDGKKKEKSWQDKNEPLSSDSNRSAVEFVYENHRRDLVEFLRRQFGGGPPDPEDIAQLAFEKLLRRPSVKDIKSLRAFLWSTARNLTISSLRRDKVRDAYDFEVEHLYFAESGAGKGTARVVEVEQQLSIISAVLSKMPTNLQQTFLLHKVDGLNRAEVARRQNISPTAVVKRLAKVAAEIDDALEHGLDERDSRE